MKITKNDLANMINEEIFKALNEGQRPGEVSGPDLLASLTLAIDEVFQELRPDKTATEEAFRGLIESLDSIFRESYAASSRAAKMLGADMEGFQDLD